MLCRRYFLRRFLTLEKQYLIGTAYRLSVAASLIRSYFVWSVCHRVRQLSPMRIELFFRSKNQIFRKRVHRVILYVRVYPFAVIKRETRVANQILSA